MTSEGPVYVSYLLRLWRVGTEDESLAASEGAAWRASLEDPQTGQRQGFACPEDLFEFLRAQIGAGHRRMNWQRESTDTRSGKP